MFHEQVMGAAHFYAFLFAVCHLTEPELAVESFTSRRQAPAFARTAGVKRSSQTRQTWFVGKATATVSQRPADRLR